MPYLETVGFRSTTLICMFDLRANLISALVEGWCLETYTFHLPCRECTITLKDVALQLRLLFDGSAITGTSSESATLCYHLLGCSPHNGEDRFTSLKFSLLRGNFEHLLSSAIE
ncbi:hypothetical protein J1N35_022104 [Gossypium stocksii]|uniref:Aminotransferase-like plant mobile domain-containing protein n=1 Tax=Gossypium stocksii TaxID=47602 RepID=A0A9D4A1Y7_9ROSI|nr:hypothetical protein J1N35_022104 [Gossypium stocksii]